MEWLTTDICQVSSISFYFLAIYLLTASSSDYAELKPWCNSKKLSGKSAKGKVPVML
jgi:hypothetical protein